MCHEGHRGRRGYRRHFGRRRFDREEMLPRLEEYQKDLEQELADVADLIKRLKEEKPTETATV
jgi:ADP-dependent phosphofructokinase/glucokinase